MAQLFICADLDSTIRVQQNAKEISHNIELTLKNELGIYSFESPDKVTSGTTFQSYKEADNEVKNYSPFREMVI